MERNMERESMYGQMVATTRENGRITQLMDMYIEVNTIRVNIIGQMVEYIRDSGG